MKLNRIPHILLSLLMGTFTFFSLLSCEEEKEDLGPASVSLSQGELSFDSGVGETVIQLTATRDWATYSFPDWVAVTPDHGVGSTKPQDVTIVVLPNPDMDRSTDLVFTIGLSKIKLTVKQKGEGGSLEEALIYKNDFDKEVSTQSYGSSGTSWPYMDQFEGWINHTGNGVEDVSYEFASMSVRNNSNSDGNYSDYEGSGLNNLLFGAGNKFEIKNIDIHDATSFALTFGTEKYANGADDNTFQHSEFHVYVSDNGQRWVELEYTFPNGEKNGRWDLATSKFSVPEGTGELYLYFKSDLASGHRMDDVVLMRSGSSSTEIDFTTGDDVPGSSGSGIYDKNAIYYNDFDKTVSTQSFGSSGNSWPFLDQFDGWNNEKGSGIGSLVYAYNAMSVRSNSNSNAGYSDYKGSGANNLMFGSGSYLSIGHIELGTNTALTLEFGTEKYAYGVEDNTFQHSEFHVYLSDDGQRWVEVEYAFPNGDKNGRWDLASVSFNVPGGTANLYVYFKSTLASAHRLDDVQLRPASSAPTLTIDFTQGTDIIGGGSGLDTKDAIFYNDFDKTTATQTNSQWPFMDQFDGWKNEKGSGIANLTYKTKSMSVRSNSASNSSYSDYPGSGENNLMFGNESYVSVGDLDLGGNTALTVCFGTEKYWYGSDDNTHDHLVKLYVSQDGKSWVELQYEFPNGDPNGRWDLASSSFNVPAGTSTLHILLSCTNGGIYRVDDLLLSPAKSAPSLTVDWSQGVNIDLEGGGSTGIDTSNAIYYDNFDKTVATQTYGTSGSSWPYLDQFDGWKNATGSGASAVCYGFKAMSARANSTSDSQYSDYPGSGSNNLFFGTDNFFWVGDIDLGGTTSLKLSFGSERYKNGEDNTFNHTEFKVYVSNDGKKWVEIPYVFDGGDKDGRWAFASSEFSVPSSTSKLSIYFKSTLASAHRLDDVLLSPGSATAQSIDFANGIELDTDGTTTGGGGDDTGYNPPVGAMTLSEIAAASDNTVIAAENVFVGAVTTRGYVVTDGATNLYVYLNEAPSVKVGDKVNFYGTKTTYYGLPEITEPTTQVVSSGNTVPYGNPLDITSSFDSFDSSSYDYITFTATVVKSGNYTNFQVQGATAYVGALSSAPSSMYDGIAEGDNVTVTGYFNGHNTSSKLLNVIAVEVKKTDGGTTGGFDFPVEPTSIADLLGAAEQATVAAKDVFVSAVTTRGFVVTDGGANVYVYENKAPEVKVGDKVDFYGTMAYYYGMPEVTSPTYRVVSSGNTVPYGNPVDITSVFDSYTSTSYDYITFAATVTKNGNYTNFKVDGATTYVGSLSSAPSSMYDGADEGKQVIVYGYFNGHNDNNGLLNVIAVKLTNIDGTDLGSGGDDNPGGDGDTPTGSFSSNVTWTLGDNAYDQSATVNGTADVPVLKLGTSSKVGSATVTLPAGTSSVTFYGVSWKAKAATLSIKDVSGAPAFSKDLPTNDGATGNPVYTITVTENDKSTWTLSSPLTEATTYTLTTEGSNTRVILFAVNAVTQ